MDRAAMDVARKYNIPLCGWCPKGGWAEDYPSAPGLLRDYPELKETPAEGTEQRTLWNMRDAGAILTILPEGSLPSKGTDTGLEAGKKLGKPMYTASGIKDVPGIIRWMKRLPEGTEICVGGPRASECSGAYRTTEEIMTEVITMMEKFPAYTKVDMENWPRKEHFKYYQEKIPCSHSVTRQVDVTRLLMTAHEKGVRFSACLMYAVCRTVNELECTRMMVDEEGNPGIWDVSNPVFTVFHQDDHTFSDLWMDYVPDFPSFSEEHEKTIKEYGDRKGIKGRPGQPENFFCFSCAPWLDFDAYSCYSSGSTAPPLFPIIACGRYTESHGRYRMPVSLTISHAAMDGYHISLFFEKLQEEIEGFGK